MKKILVLASVGSLLLSCSATQFNRTQRRQMKDTYVYEFKMTYFKKMLLAGFGNSNEIKMVVAQDHSNFGEIVLTQDDYRFIDSLVASDLAKIRADSAASYSKAEGAAGKRVFDRVLEQYQSRWLTNIAKERSRSYTDIKLTARN